MGIAHIHLFWDDNGRIARLLANIPLLKADLPPLIIKQKERWQYIQALAKYQIAIGQLISDKNIWPDLCKLKPFEIFCSEAYTSTKIILDTVFKLQRKRKTG